MTFEMNSAGEVVKTPNEYIFKRINGMEEDEGNAEELEEGSRQEDL
eukprot:CAMPEP_0170567810 /NCGR_PEP_ID=MMETSP0211-20121228/80724_1 /TAXON_ID=311385 /ORGANISM="Pseudokeronopsis sp., Strain OXSARD2" /LENGTH=45 /DNA_ID= /DNA_START= /DNA_END= /DNA_ORIENTATION=